MQDASERHCFLPAVLACATAGLSEPRAITTPPIALPRLDVVLPNGLRVVALPDPAATLVEVDLRFSVGARHDPPGRRGLAHLVEHLTFLERARADPENRPEYRDEPVDAALARLAIGNNAFTTYDATHYMALAAPASLEALVMAARTLLNRQLPGRRCELRA
ncbi:MAG: insulinase family protein [Myxococcales bacterium]|nr:insulinase family protein [Myxococcales bacterium]